MSIKEISKELIKAFTANNKRLSKLDFSKNAIKIIQNLNDLKYLQVLNLADNQIEQIDGLSELSLLQSVDLSSNLISTVTNIKNLKNLEVLDLSFNRLQDIRDLSELKHNKKLTELNVQGNVNITCFHDYREKIKQLIPQISKIDGLIIRQSNSSSIPDEIAEQQTIEAYKGIINVLEKQVKTQNPDALEQWRKKCFELLQREKIMNYRFNQQETLYSKEINGNQQKLKEQIEQNSYLQEELLRKQQEIVKLNESLEQTKIFFDSQLKKDTQIIYNQFENQMNQLQELLNSSLKSQQKRFFNLEGTLLKQKAKIINQKRQASTDFIEFKESLRSIINAHTNTELKADINTDEFANEVERVIRDSFIQLNQNKFKQASSTNKFEIKQLSEEIHSLKQQNMNLTSVLEEQESNMQKINRNCEQKLKQLADELDVKSKKVKEQMQLIVDLEQKLERENQEKSSQKLKVNELQDNYSTELKIKVEEVTQKLKQRMEELEKENQRLQSGMRDKEQEITVVTENLWKKVQQAEADKLNEINVFENKLMIEMEKKNTFSNQCNDLMRIIKMKDNKTRQLQEKLNQTMNHEFGDNNPNINNHTNNNFYQNNRANVSHNDIYNNQNYQQMTYQNQRIQQQQTKPLQNQVNNAYNMKNYQQSSNPILNQTDIQYNYKGRQQQQQQLHSQEDWSPVANKTNISYNAQRQPYKQTLKNQEINNFTTNKANMILNDLSIIQNEHPGADTLEDELKKLEQNEMFAQEILNDDI